MLATALSLIPLAHGALLTETIAPIHYLPDEIISHGVALFLFPTSLLLFGMTCKDFHRKCHDAFLNLYTYSRSPSAINVETLYDIYNEPGPVDPSDKLQLELLILKHLPAPYDLKHSRVYKLYKEALFSEGAQKLPIISSKRFPELCRMIFKYKAFTEFISYEVISELLKPYVIDVGLPFLKRLNEHGRFHLEALEHLEPDSATIFWSSFRKYGRFIQQSYHYKRRRRIIDFYISCLQTSNSEVDKIVPVLPKNLSWFLRTFYHQLLKSADPQIVSVLLSNIDRKDKVLERILVALVVYKYPLSLYAAIRGENYLKAIKSILLQMDNDNEVYIPDDIPVHVLVEAGIMLDASDESILKLLKQVRHIPPYISLIAMIKNVHNTVFYAILEKTSILKKDRLKRLHGKCPGFVLNPFLFAHFLSHKKSNLRGWFKDLWRLALPCSKHVGLLKILPRKVQKELACYCCCENYITKGLAKALNPLESLSDGLIWMKSLGGKIKLDETGYEFKDILEFMADPSDLLTCILSKTPQDFHTSLSSFCLSNTSETAVLCTIAQRKDALPFLYQQFESKKQTLYFILFASQSPHLSISQMVEDMSGFHDIYRFFRFISSFYEAGSARFHNQIDALYRELGKRIDDQRYLRIFSSLFFWHINCDSLPSDNPIFAVASSDNLTKIFEFSPELCLHINESKKWSEYLDSHGLSQCILEIAIRNGFFRNVSSVIRLMGATVKFLGLTIDGVEALCERIGCPLATRRCSQYSNTQAQQNSGSHVQIFIPSTLGIPVPIDFDLSSSSTSESSVIEDISELYPK